MKKVVFLTNLILSFIITTTFVSCNKSDDNGGNSVSINTISAKWKISDSNSPYSSFEFSKDGNYIVVANGVETNLRSLSTSLKSSLFKKNSSKAKNLRSSESESNLSPIHFGTYTIEGNKIILSGFGSIEVISITAKEFTFSFTLEATGEKNSFVAGKSEEPISSSSKTDMLCRTWVLERLTDEDNNDIEVGETDDIMIGNIVLFSRAGTYLVLYGGEGGDAGLSEWKWANSQETQFYYSWANWTDDWNDNLVTITDLKSTSLVIQEDGMIYYLRLKQ